MELEVRTEETKAGVITVKPKGTVNSDTCNILDKAISNTLSKSIKTLVIDMSEVKFISSAGVGVIIKTKATSAKYGADFAMTNLQPQVKKVFEIIGLLPALNVFESTEELDEYLEKIQHAIIDGDLEL